MGRSRKEKQSERAERKEARRESRGLRHSATREIRAYYGEDFVRVYQAYSDSIADPALEAQRFVSPWSEGRMTWIKPSFCWMGYRCGWGSKDHAQSRVLAVDLHRDGFDQLLRSAVPVKHQKGRADVIVQWDPERALGGESKHAHTHELPAVRSLQMGLRGAATRQYAAEGGLIARIEDVTGVFLEVGELLKAGEIEAAAELLPEERVYPVEEGLAICAVTHGANAEWEETAVAAAVPDGSLAEARHVNSTSTEPEVGNTAPAAEAILDGRGWQVPGLLSEAECVALIEAPCELQTKAYPANGLSTGRLCMRCQIEDPRLALLVEERLEGLVPQRIGDWELDGLSDQFRVIKYEPGHYYGLHIDHSNGSEANGNERRSFYTIMVYLNNQCEFDGGNLVFRLPKRVVEVVPRTGLGVVFLQDDRELLHEGGIVHSGAKWILRGDFYYTRPEPQPDGPVGDEIEGDEIVDYAEALFDENDDGACIESIDDI